MNMILFHNKYKQMKTCLTLEHLLNFADSYEPQKITNPQNFAQLWTYYYYLKYKFVKLHHCRICVTDFREGGLFALPFLLLARECHVSSHQVIKQNNVKKRLSSSTGLLMDWKLQTITYAGNFVT